MAVPSLETVVIGVDPLGYAVVELARPHKSNAFTNKMLGELEEAMLWCDRQRNIQAVIIKGNGKNFCAGIDLESLSDITALMNEQDSGRASTAFRQKIMSMQEAFNAIERCRWPVIAAIHGACIGGGVDLIAACDLRVCSADAIFSVKEVDLAITADLGSLQRLPPIIGHGATMELALTARTVSAAEAKALGLISNVLDDENSLHSFVEQLAATIAAKSPVAVTGTKLVLLQSRDHTIRDGLDFVATLNAGQALSQDLREVFAAKQGGRRPVFSRL